MPKATPTPPPAPPEDAAEARRLAVELVAGLEMLADAVARKGDGSTRAVLRMLHRQAELVVRFLEGLDAGERS